MTAGGFKSSAWAVLLIGLLFASLFSAAPVCGGRQVVAYFFWSPGCPHCRDEKAFLEKLQRKYPLLRVKLLEVMNNRGNAELLSRMGGSYGVKVAGVPALFVGEDEPFIGYSGDASTGNEIESRVRHCLDHGCPDPMMVSGRPGHMLIPLEEGPADEGICSENEKCPEVPDKGASPGARQPAPGSQTYTVELPLIGKVDSSKAALPYQTLIIAGMDAFNPCAFFVLFTLLGLMIHVQSKRRLLLVGGIFVFFSGLIYFIFMAAWLNVFLLAGRIGIVTMVAGVVALVIAGLNIKDFFFFRKGISLMIPDTAKPRLFDRMRKLLGATSLMSVIIATVVLAVAANAYELFCTAGFPMVYTRILTLHSLTRLQYYLYLMLYNLIYVIPLGTIVLLFAFTVGAKKLTEWQGKVLKLLSGMMMLCLGAVLLINPDLLNSVLVTAGLFVLALSCSALMVYLSSRPRKKST